MPDLKKDYTSGSQRLRLEKAWLGEGPVCLRVYDTDSQAKDEGPIPGQEIPAIGNRFQIDEEERTLISTSSKGGLVVLCLDTGEQLFQLSYVSIVQLLEIA